MKRIFTFIAVLVIAIPSLAVTLRVPSQYPTIQAGINAAANGDTVLVANGTYTGAGNKNIDFSGKAIVVMSENGAENCIIDCEQSGRGFIFQSGEGLTSVLAGFKITRGNLTGARGAGIYCSLSSPTIQHCIISGNTSDDCAGGIDFTDSSSAVISNCIITENAATLHGGGILCELSSHISLVNCEISGNSAHLGGGIFITDYANPNISGCVFSNNTSSGDGGAVYCHAGAVPTISGCQFTGNYAGWSGASIIILNTCFSIDSSAITNNNAFWDAGGIYIYNSLAPSLITNCTISSNTAGWRGAGIRIVDVNTTISDCDITNNIAQEEGGGISFSSYCIFATTVNITNSLISGNSSSQGGGIWNYYNSTLNVDSCIITENSSSGSGGGIYSETGSPLTISNSIISNNSCLNAGGGLHCVDNSTLTVNNCEINGNTAGFTGGGIYNTSSLGPYISYSSICGNDSTANGGAIHSVGSSPEIKNCTLSGNVSPGGGLGGALLLDGCNNIILSNTIFEGNSNFGIYFINPVFTSFGYCDFHSNSVGDWYFETGGAPPGLGVIDTTNANGDSCDIYMNIYLNPMFIDPSAYNYFLQAGSPCIDAGDPNSPLDPDSSIADIGAHWYGEVAVETQNSFEPPSIFALHPAYPNPFNSSTAISFELQAASYVKLVVYDIAGREVAVLVDGYLSSGYHQAVFEAGDLASGVYFARLTAGDFVQTRKMLLLK